MILVAATVRLHSGRAADDEAAVARIRPKVRAASPGIVFYRAAHCRDEPETYCAEKAYADEVAMDRHVANASLQASLSGLMPSIAAFELKLRDVVA